MAATFELEIATPEKLLVKEAVTEAQLPTADGEIGVLPGHAPLLSELGIGVISFVTEGKRLTVAVSSGIIEVLPDLVRVLAMVAELPADIDMKRAREAERRARERLDTIKENVDSARALNALKRAQARLSVAEMNR
ncbi:MAG: F0F1 ATP synthase subunit epsilon [Acidobacteria bacterium]|nr:F0F1 ATP synthase subunit epsilon [Acidobacteriota bacterium]